MKWILLILFMCLTCSVLAQNISSPQKTDPDPKIAFLKSLAVPGWGHHYVDKSDWTRGQYHLAAEATLLLSYIGFTLHSDNLRQNWVTYARTEAGVDIAKHDRAFRLAVGNFKNLETYNDYQERSRNWDRLYEDIPSNQWSWSTAGARNHYRDLRERFETMDQQLPALLSLMVVNRVISAVSAYNRAKKKNESATTALQLAPYSRAGGIVAHLTISF